MKKKFGRVGVLAGGPSSEREISLRSGKAVHSALLAEGVDAIFLDVFDNIRDIIGRNAVDVAFIALHGRFGEDGTVQKILEEMRIPYTGSGVEASRRALDKVMSKDVFMKNGIATPRYIVFEKSSFRAEDAAFLGFPVVVKPHLEGSSIGLSIAHDVGGLKDAAEKAFGHGDKVVVEEYIDGRELTVGILDDKALPVIEIVTKNRFYDYTAKYSDPETRYLVPAPLGAASASEAQDLARRAHAALGCRSFSRIDIMMSGAGRMFVLEANTVPGMTERSLLPKAAQAAGMSFGRLCVALIDGAFANGSVRSHGE